MLKKYQTDRQSISMWHYESLLPVRTESHNFIHLQAQLQYILESNPHSVFGDFLNGKKLVHSSDWIILDVTSALKSDATPGADESYRYHEAGLSQ
jgi:hypothetical protein